MSSTKQLPSTLSLYLPLFIIFILTAVFFSVGTDAINKIGLKPDYKVLQAANVFWLLLSMLTLLMQKKALKNKNPNVFVRAVMGSMLMKMMAGALAVLIYFMVSQKAFNQHAVVIFLLLYVIYLAVEVKIIMKLNQSSHG